MHIKSKEDAAAYARVLQAYSEGRVIQYNNQHGWEDIKEVPEFIDHPEQYRVKPDPLPWYRIAKFKCSQSPHGYTVVTCYSHLKTTRGMTVEEMVKGWSGFIEWITPRVEY